MHRLLRLSLPLVLLAASGCGFRLQGETSLPPVLAALRVQTADSQTDFAQALERALQRLAAQPQCPFWQKEQLETLLREVMQQQQSRQQQQQQQQQR